MTMEINWRESAGARHDHSVWHIRKISLATEERIQYLGEEDNCLEDFIIP